ncbi:MAG: hypothetical protein IJI73_05170 [Kiritimatiellae bacterium]|nr:hypothetical protein [Kiritimatiellia bacterium]
MKKLIISAVFACGLVAAIEAAPGDAVTQADLKALIERINKLEAENKAQAEKIARLEGRIAGPAAVKAEEKGAAPALAREETTEVSESGRVYKTAQGYSYYLADKFAGIFEPLSDAGLKITPYGWLVAEIDYNSHSTEVDTYTDYVRRKSHRSYKDGTMVFSMQDSILGIRFETPEKVDGWKFSGKAEFDLAGDHANDYAFHWRHLYTEAEHDSGWSILFGQTWHLWRMVTPSEIDGAWMENTGHPYRRSPQIRVTKKWDFKENGTLEARVGLVKNGPGMGGDRDGDGNQDNSASRWALVEGALLYERDAFWTEAEGKETRRWLVGVAGMYGRDRSHRASEWDDDGLPVAFDGTSDDYDSQMLMFAASLPLSRRFTLCGQLFAGENLGGIQAGVGQRVAYRPDHRRGTCVRTIGGFVDLNFNLTPDDEKWSFAAGYGFDDPQDSDAHYAEGICYNDRAYIDAFYRVNANLHFGVEYAYLTTKYYDEGRANDHRFQITAFYDF